MHHVKALIVGDTGVGKTSLQIAFATNTFNPEHTPTLTENYTKHVIIDGKSYNIFLWDTEGDAYYDRLRPLSYPQTDVFVVCYSIVSPSSYEHVITKWIPEITHHCPGVPYLLTGTKLDLRDDPKTLESLRESSIQPISRKEGIELAKKIKAYGFYETSALNHTNLKELFDECIYAITGISQKKNGKCYLM